MLPLLACAKGLWGEKKILFARLISSIGIAVFSLYELDGGSEHIGAALDVNFDND